MIKPVKMHGWTANRCMQIPEPRLQASMTWEFVERLKNSTTIKVVIKDIVTAQDAKSAVQHGADAVIISNHGGRAEASDWVTLVIGVTVGSGHAPRITGSTPLALSCGSVSY